MRPLRSVRAWIYVLSVAALLVPAGGIAYLGAVSYRDEKGAVSAQDDRQRQATLAIAARVDHAIDAAIGDAERAAAPIAHGDSNDARALPGLARFWFWIDAEGRLRVPRGVTSPRAATSGLDRGAACGGRLEDCLRELSTRPDRLGTLRAARHDESCVATASTTCAEAWKAARTAYVQLASFEDTGPAAIIGLARLEARSDSASVVAATDAAIAAYSHRFAHGAVVDGLPIALVVSEVRAERGPPGAKLELAEAIVAGRYAIDAVTAFGIVASLRAGLTDDLPPELAPRRAAIDERISGLRMEARAAAGLAADKDEIIRDAGTEWHGRPASRDPGRTLIYRRTGNGIVGIAVDAPMLEAAAGHEPSDDVAPHVRALVLPADTAPPKDLRTIQQIPLGAHLAIALVNPLADPDPLDEVIRTRSRRHVALTSALALALGLGLLATIRGAARARELAQLKSEFVSTVSHELKTPLTSIRMFAEMLEQGVAKGDPDKAARYHSVIVQESQRLGLLIANLLDYAQIERGTRRYAPNRQLVGPIAELAVATFETLREPEAAHGEAESAAIPRNPIALVVSSAAKAAEVEVDRDVVVQAVLNLMNNAAKYGGAERPIEVEVGADPNAAWIAVRDHGPGIPAHEHARIFREFYRAPEAYRSGVEGTGLGLALVKRHVEALGGTVEVASTVGEGAMFTIRFPRVQEPA